MASHGPRHQGGEAGPTGGEPQADRSRPQPIRSRRRRNRPTRPRSPSRAWRTDPSALLAEAAGYRDHELWWESQIERRSDATGLFAAILEAMNAVRADVPGGDPGDLLRESHMRQTLRSMAKEGFRGLPWCAARGMRPCSKKSAVFGKLPGCTAKEDAAALRGLPKTKTAVTWIPWSHDRLTYRSGYGAGVESPGWYAHVWTSQQEAPLRWIATAARLLREADLDASPASIIEAVRLADALAVIRHFARPAWPSSTRPCSRSSVTAIRRRCDSSGGGLRSVRFSAKCPRRLPPCRWPGTSNAGRSRCGCR